MKTAAISQFAHKSLAWVGLGIAGALLSIAQPTPAQTTTSQDLIPQAGGSDASATPFSNSSSPLSGMFQLIHQAQMGQIRDTSQFNQDQQENLGSAAADFRTRQIELLQQQQGQSAQTDAPGMAQPAQ